MSDCFQTVVWLVISLNAFGWFFHLHKLWVFIHLFLSFLSFSRLIMMFYSFYLLTFRCFWWAFYILNLIYCCLLYLHSFWISYLLKIYKVAFFKLYQSFPFDVKIYQICLSLHDFLYDWDKALKLRFRKSDNAKTWQWGALRLKRFEVSH